MSCKWMFNVKSRSDGMWEKNKVRVLVKGYVRIYGIDYQETFAPVAKMISVRVILSIAVNID